MQPRARAFQQWIDNKYYEDITFASYVVNRRFEARIYITYFKAPRTIKRGEKISIPIPKLPLDQIEKEWKHALATIFFKAIAMNPKIKLKQPENQNIKNYLKKNPQRRNLQNEKRHPKTKNNTPKPHTTQQNILDPK